MLQVKLNHLFEGVDGRTSRWKCFLREAQLFAWKTADSLGHDYLEFMDQRTMAAREGGLTPAPQRSVKLWLRDGGKLRMEVVGGVEVLGNRVVDQGDVYSTTRGGKILGMEKLWKNFGWKIGERWYLLGG